MIEPKFKPCKGTGKAIGSGCGEKAQVRKYGLCMKCYPSWLYGTEEGNKVVEKHRIGSKKKTEDQQTKEWNETKKAKRPYTHYKENKKALGSEIQKLARLIDIKYGHNTCIDCGQPFTQAQDRDGGHFKSKGSNESIRYNLHNIHSQKSNCNRNGLGGGKERQFFIGLVARYGAEYAQLVDTGLQQKYKYIGLKQADYPEKLAIVRKLIRDLDTFQFENAYQAREQLNQIIGIYK